MSTVSVRYIVHDVDAALAFYRDRLGFSVASIGGDGASTASRQLNSKST